MMIVSVTLKNELNELLEELLTYARLDQLSDPVMANMRSEPISNWFASVMYSLESLSGQKTLVWQVEALSRQETTLMSPVMMNRVVNNLVQNALRFAESRVEVLLGKQGSEYVLQVDDDGPGIPVAEQERLPYVMIAVIKT